MRGNVFFFQAEDGIRDFCLARGLGDVYKGKGGGSASVQVLKVGVPFLASSWS